ncbi:MAG: hypothetical protein A2V67_00290 [Deltaproteobacteria bacterium RBG_13_61_14]|nr:MAG: hypothetical protein A2V67_00290 [Deltaproteobacteria bacterium RBG_13_61_14]
MVHHNLVQGEVQAVQFASWCAYHNQMSLVCLDQQEIDIVVEELAQVPVEELVQELVQVPEQVPAPQAQLE